MKVRKKSSSNIVIIIAIVIIVVLLFVIWSMQTRQLTPSEGGEEEDVSYVTLEDLDLDELEDEEEAMEEEEIEEETDKEVKETIEELKEVMEEETPEEVAEVEPVAATEEEVEEAEVPEEVVEEEKPTPTPVSQPVVDKETNTMTVTEGDLVSFPNLKATDPDGDPIEFTFSSPLNSKGEWRTNVGDAGTYDVLITASDGESEIAEKVRIIVEEANKAPTITIASSFTVDEGTQFELKPIVEDPDGDPVDVSYAGWMNSNKKALGYEDSGVYEVIIKAADESHETIKKVTVTVKNVNRGPEFVSII